MPLPSSYLSNRSISIRSHKVVLGALYYQKWGNPAAASTNVYQTTFTAPNTATVTHTRTGIVAGNSVFAGTLANGLPDFPRNVVITVTHATAVVALSGVITGSDIYGNTITEAWAVTATGTTKTFTGKKSFYQVDSVTIVAAADASADSVIIGTGAVFGLDVLNAVASAVKETAVGSVVTTGTLVAASTASTADSRGTYAPSTAPDGAKTYEVWILTNQPELSAG